MKVAFWLIPVDRVYQTLIDRFADRYDAPKFAPHVTIHSSAYQDNILDVLETIPQDMTHIVLEIDQVLYSEQFTKSLFIQFHPNDNLNRLSQFLKERFPSQFELNPHLSLIYHHFPEAEKSAIAAEIELPDRVRFNQVSAIAYDTTPQTRADVEAWRMIGR